MGFIIGALALDDANDINGCTFSDGFLSSLIVKKCVKVYLDRVKGFHPF